MGRGEGEVKEEVLKMTDVKTVYGQVTAARFKLTCASMKMYYVLISTRKVWG